MWRQATRGLLSWLNRARSSPKSWTLLGVMSAVVVTVNANILVARFYSRFDLTRAGAYTLTAPTLNLLERLDQPVDVIVLLSRADTLTGSVRNMLTAYTAQTQQLRVRFVDPDRNPAEFLAIQNKYDIVAGRTQDGKLVTDASLIVVRGEHVWFITVDDMLHHDREGNVEPRLEHALSEGIANVLSSREIRACFTTGHGELSPHSGGPKGLGELTLRMMRNNFKVETVDLSRSKITTARLARCDLVVVAEPELPVSEAAENRLISYFEGGGRLLLLLSPVSDRKSGRMTRRLTELLATAKLTLGGDYVLETDAERRLPGGSGAQLLARTEPHEITQGLAGVDKPELAVWVVGAQSVSRLPGSGRARPLLSTSERAYSVKSAQRLEGGRVTKRPSDSEGPFWIAAASELDPVEGKKSGVERRPRMVVVGTASVAWSQNFRDPALMATGVFLENAIAWVAASPPLVDVPAKPSRTIHLSLTEESLQAVLRYVLLYMPGAALMIGAFLLVRRRRGEHQFRQNAKGARRLGRRASSGERRPQPAEDK